MSPFSILLGELRRSRGLRQSKLADKMSYEQSYLSALEMGTKGPPTEEFISKMDDVLHLNEFEREQVKDAILRSSRKFILPIKAPRSMYELCYELNKSASLMQPRQIEIIANILRLLNETNCDDALKDCMHKPKMVMKLEGKNM